MLTWFYKRLIPNWDQYNDPRVRRLYGMYTGSFGLAVNILLAAGKIFIGWLSGSAAITADGFNNFADSAASIVSLISFRMATKPADREHPFGHARIEYVGATVVGLLTLLIAWEMGKRAFNQIISPEPVRFSWVFVAILAVSMVLKLALYAVNRKTGAIIDSQVMRATAIDSLSDVAATAAVLISLIAGRVTALPVDGIISLLVSLFIVRAGIGILKDTINALIGERPDQALEERILAYIRSNPNVLGVHDLVVHDYGSGRTFTSAHVEVDAGRDIIELHEAIDAIERKLAEQEGISLVLHMDPIVLDDPQLNALRDEVDALVRGMDPDFSMHDFRVVPGRDHTNLIFDVVVPPEYPLTDEALKSRIDRQIREIDPHYYTVIVFDRTYSALPSNEIRR